MMQEFLKLAYLSVACGAASLVVAKGRVFNGMHEWLAPRFPRLQEMLSCPWCLSHWVSLALVVAYRPLAVTGVPVLDYIVAAFVMVALASVAARLIFWAYSAMVGE